MAIYPEFYQENHIDRKYKMIDYIVLDDGSLWLNAIQQIIEEELRIFWNINGVHDMARLRLLMTLSSRKRKSESAKTRVTAGT